MSILGVRKSLLIGSFLTFPIGGIMLYTHFQPNPGFSVMLSVENGRAVVGNCLESPDYESYLDQLNKTNKSKNIECIFSGQLTTKSKGIECKVVNGPVVAYFYWAETVSECNKIKDKIKT